MLANRVILRCDNCQDEDFSWDYPQFLKALWPKFQKSEIVSQYCYRCARNTPHGIVGMSITQRVEFDPNISG